TVTVNDTEKPVISCPANLSVATAPGVCASNVTFVVTAKDGRAGGRVRSVPASGSSFPKGTTTVLSTATDVSGNASTCSFVVTVNDNCPGVSVTSVPASGSSFPKGTTTVLSTATDAAGNASTCSFTVTVNDTEKPVISCPANLSVATAPGVCASNVTFVVTA